MMTVFDISRLRCTAIFFEFFEQCFRYYVAPGLSALTLGNSHLFCCG